MPEEVKKQVRKKPIKKAEETTEQYQYVPEEDEKLIMDKPSEPLTKKDSPVKEIIEEIIISEPVKKKEIKKIAPTMKSNKELYESYIRELKKFSLSINGEIIYDSNIDKTGNVPVKFENDYFILYGKKYSYNGLKIQKIN